MHDETHNGEHHALAKQLHDGVTQELTAATFYAKVIYDTLKREGHHRLADVATLQETLAKANKSLQEIYRNLGGL